MRCAAIVVLATLILGVPLLFPAGDLPATPYDESETLPYDTARVSSVAVGQRAGLEIEDAGAPSGAPSAPDEFVFPFTDTCIENVTRPEDMRGVAALLCTIRC
jgi:hypothetical protein